MFISKIIYKFVNKSFKDFGDTSKNRNRAIICDLSRSLFLKIATISCNCTIFGKNAICKTKLKKTLTLKRI